MSTDKLFDHMFKEHGIALLDGELHDIRQVVWAEDAEAADLPGDGEAFKVKLKIDDLLTAVVKDKQDPKELLRLIVKDVDGHDMGEMPTSLTGNQAKECLQAFEDLGDNIIRRKADFKTIEQLQKQLEDCKKREGELLKVLKLAVDWDGSDDHGVDAVWLNEAEQAIKNTEDEVTRST